MSDSISIRTDLVVGDLGRIISLHGRVYEPLGGYGQRFEAFVGRTIAEFVLENNARGQIWLVEKDGELLGCSAAVLRDGNIGQVRWVVLDPSLRGQGIGKSLVQKTLDYCRDQNCTAVVLETTDGLRASQTLYESFGFVITSESIEELWDGPRPLVHMRLELT